MPCRHFRVLALLATLLPALGHAQDSVFRITPLQPIATLRRAADRARPPAESGDFLPTDLVDVASLASGIKLDVRYATAQNFLGEPVYGSARAFLQRPAAEALVRAHRALAASGYGLLIHDAYRPWRITWLFWEATPPAQREFVADPTLGSKHNRGCAVDITLYDLRTGAAVQMPSGYDEFTPRAYADYPGGTDAERARRATLRRALEAEGFTVNPSEWWHFDCRDWRRYRIANIPFDSLTLRR